MSSAHDWEICRLGDLCSFRTGPFGSTLHKSDYTIDGIPVVNPMHIVDARLIPTSDMTISEAAAERLAEFRLREDDIIIGRRGEMGRCAIVGSSEAGWICGTGSMIIRRHSGISMQYLQRVLSSSQTVRRLEDSSVGTTMININQSVLAALAIPLPPLPEQRAIATALSDADALIAALDRLIAKKRAIKQGAMQRLLTGEVRLEGFEGEWMAVCLDQITARVTGFWGADVPTASAPNLVGVIRAGDISSQGLLTGHALRHFSDTELSVAQCQVGDIVMTVSGNGLGKTWLFDGHANLAVSNFVRILRPKGNLANAAYLSQVLKSAEAVKCLVEHTATSAYPNLRPSFFSTAWLDLPPMEEQCAIATVLSDMDAEIAALERQCDKTRAVKQGMMQDLLTGRVRLVQAGNKE